MLDQHGFAVIADEATDVNNTEQINVSVQWVGNDYKVHVHVHEDSIGLCAIPDTTADTLCKIIKDILIRCSSPFELLRGQAYDVICRVEGKE